ncbi:DUF4244 domain-containing protein [Spongiactinospora sp. TRM90649]|uniref:DUF4244 domain-containing protein n=1 Tax=Spongiactinospora sp. TRM90649 TaxID=3031114 RepID=UPI003211A812
MGDWMMTARKFRLGGGGASVARVGHLARAATSGLATRCAARFAMVAKAGGDRGMSTAEYAMGTLAACGFAALLYKVVTGTEIQEALSGLINKALTIAG